MYITKRLFSFLKNIKLQILQISISSTVFNIVTVLKYGVIGKALSFAVTKNKEQLILWIFLAVFVIVLELLVKKYDDKQQDKANLKTKAKMRGDLLTKLFKLGPNYTEYKPCTDISSAVWYKLEWFAYYYLEYIPCVMSIVFTCTALFFVLMKFSKLVAMSVIIITLVLLAIPIVFFRITEKTEKSQWNAQGFFDKICLDGIKGIATLKVIGANALHREKVKQASEKLRKSIMTNLFLTTINTKAIEITVLLAVFIPFIIGVTQGADIVVLFFILIGYKQVTSKLLGAWLKASKGLTALDGIFDILEAETRQTLVSTENKSDYSLDGDVVFENVSFSYGESEELTLKNISFTVKKGKTTAFVGSSGSGKTTAIKLLYGFYKTTNGTISVGDVPLNNGTLKSFRKEIGCVWQSNHLFGKSVYDNIALSKPNATKDEVYTASKRANIHDFIMSLPDGYDTKIGDGDRSFSGGENQRIAIARVFLKNPSILVLDEATSALDRNNETEILESINELGQGRTVIKIAHRLETVRDADEICVFHNGEIVERGTHEKLLENSIYYNALISATEKTEVAQ